MSYVPLNRWRSFVERVVDGDTVMSLVDLGLGVQVRVSVRLAGIETAELRGHDKHAGREARSALATVVETSDWWVLEGHGRCRYGRVLGVLRHPRDGWTVQRVMVERGVAWWIDEGRRPRGAPLDTLQL